MAQGLIFIEICQRRNIMQFQTATQMILGKYRLVTTAVMEETLALFVPIIRIANCTRIIALVILCTTIEQFADFHYITK